MPGNQWTFDPEQVDKWGEIPGVTIKVDSNATNFGASGSLASGSGTATFSISSAYNGGSNFLNDPETGTTVWYSSEMASKMTDRDSSGYFTNLLTMTDKTSGSSQSTSYRKPKYEDDQLNGFGHIKIASGDYAELDDTIALRSNQEWTIVIATGVTTPSLYGCYLGSLSSSTTILSSYRWAGRRLKLKNDSDDEVVVAYSSTFESGYGGGAKSIHVISCDGNDDVYLRLNGSDLIDDTVTSGSQFNFSRLGHLQTSSTQQNSTHSFHEIIVFDKQLTGTDLTDLEGDLASKYDMTDRLISTHPHYNATASSNYSSPKTTSSNDATTGTLSLTTSESSFSMKSNTLTGGTYYTIFPVDIGTSGEITLKASWS